MCFLFVCFFCYTNERKKAQLLKHDSSQTVYQRSLSAQTNSSKATEKFERKENFHFHQGVRENVRAKFSVHCHKLRNSKAPEKLQGSTILSWPLKIFTLDFPDTKDLEC